MIDKTPEQIIALAKQRGAFIPKGQPDAALTAAQPVVRTLLEEHDLNQSPEYHKGRADGRAKGYEVGYRHATEQLAQPAALLAVQEPKKIENRCVRELRDYAKAHPEAFIFTGWYGHRVTKYLSQPAALPVPTYDVEAALLRIDEAASKHSTWAKMATHHELLAAAGSKT